MPHCYAIIDRYRIEFFGNTARPLELPYPSRAMRTADHLYIINFMPERTPQGVPLALNSDNPPSWESVNKHTRVTYADVDAGPTRTWMLQHRNDPTYKYHWDLGFGPRPAFELYDLKKDPHQVNNIANEKAYAEIQKKLHADLMAELQERQVA